MKNWNISYFFQDAINNMLKNGLMTIVSILVLAACMIIIGTSYLLGRNIDAFIKNAASQNELVAFLDEKLQDTEFSRVKSEIKKIEGVSDAIFVSKEEALKNFGKDFEEIDKTVLSGLENDNPLRNSYVVRLKNLDDYSKVAFLLSKIEGVANVREDQELVNTFNSVKNAVYLIGFWLILILAIISFVIISNTIRIAMFSRRLEINIMKFVGATDNFIRLPFVIEGLILGIFSSLIAFYAQWYIYVYVFEPLLKKLQFIEVVPFREIYSLVLISFLTIGVVLSSFGSIISIRKYLKV